MCLLVGTTGVGKTLLLKRLQYCSNKGSFSEVNEAPATIPTVGTNLVNVNVGKKNEVTIRELGGCMGPIWHNYYKDCTLLMFMLDISNPCQVASSCVQLLTVLSHEQLQDVPVLVLLNKMDSPCAVNRVELDSLIRMKEIIACAKQTISVLEISARGGQGLHELVKWINSNHHQS
ncbi:ADP-ribosylation factor-like protein 16 [Glandiceps talaboti]